MTDKIRLKKKHVVVLVVMIVSCLSLAIGLIAGASKPNQALQKCQRLRDYGNVPKVIETLFDTQLSQCSYLLARSLTTETNSLVQHNGSQSEYKPSSTPDNPAFDILPWGNVGGKLPVSERMVLVHQVNGVLSTIVDTNHIDQAFDSCLHLIDNYTSNEDKLMAANEIAAILTGYDPNETCLKLYQRVLPKLGDSSSADWARINLALLQLRVNNVAAAEDLLEKVRLKYAECCNNSGDAALYFVSTGIQINLYKLSAGNSDKLSELLETAKTKGKELTRRFNYQPWPAAYLGMLYSWELNFLLRDCRNTLNLDAINSLHQAFINDVPLGRWTWRQHKYFQDAMVFCQNLQLANINIVKEKSTKVTKI